MCTAVGRPSRNGRRPAAAGSLHRPSPPVTDGRRGRAPPAEAIYAVISLKAEPATVKELDRQLTLNEAILRTKVIRPDAR